MNETQTQEKRAPGGTVQDIVRCPSCGRSTVPYLLSGPSRVTGESRTRYCDYCSHCQYFGPTRDEIAPNGDSAGVSKGKTMTDHCINHTVLHRECPLCDRKRLSESPDATCSVPRRFVVDVDNILTCLLYRHRKAVKSTSEGAKIAQLAREARELSEAPNARSQALRGKDD